MGYAFYDNHAGRPCGYGVPATCDEPGCDQAIDRGFAFLCGHRDTIRSGKGPGCGGYFCDFHLVYVAEIKESGECICLCESCKPLAFGGDDRLSNDAEPIS